MCVYDTAEILQRSRDNCSVPRSGIVDDEHVRKVDERCSKWRAVDVQSILEGIEVAPSVCERTERLGTDRNELAPKVDIENGTRLEGDLSGS